METRLRGRQREAARNDRAILDAARAVFMRDRHATMHDIAAEAGVGVGGLYRRYPSKEELLRTVCADGLRRYIAIGEAALADTSDPWRAFGEFLARLVDAGVHQLTARLAGMFTLTDELRDLSEQAATVGDRVFRAARGSGLLRTDVTRADVTLLLEQIIAVDLGGDARTTELRRRYLSLLLDGLRADAAGGRLPGPPPGEHELALRWEAAGASGVETA